nr:oxidoreductase [Nakamurella flavida]
MPSQAGRRALITGANTGLGLASASALAAAGAQVVLAVRDLGKGRAAVERIGSQVPGARVELVRLDLADLASVAEAATHLREHEPLDVLMNNAGVMMVPQPETTADGFERQMGTNHLGHFALTAQLWPVLAPAARVIQLSSIAHYGAGRLHQMLGTAPGYTPMGAYGQSKLATALFGVELARRVQEAGSSVVSAVAHPGWSATELFSRDDGAGWSVKLARKATALAGSSPQEGARAQLFAATDPSVRNGDFIGPALLARGAPKRAKLSAGARNEGDAAWLWDESARLTQLDPDFVRA